MKPITIVQAALLVMLAVFGAYAGSKAPKACPSIVAAKHCDR